MNPQPPELFPQRPIRSDFGRVPSYRTRRIITVVVLLLLLGGIGRWIFGGPSTQHPGEIPTIKAESSTYKQKPEQPGGLDIPHQDVEVYQALDNKDAAKPEVEHLMPPPEAPQPQQSSAAVRTANNTALPPSNTAPQTENITPPAADQTPAPSPTAIPTTVATTVEPQQAKPPAASVAVQPVKPAAATLALQAVKKKAAITADKMHSVLQLASVPDEASAEDLMDKLQTRYASVLSDAQLRIVRADLGAKGIHYRIQSQPVPDADKICAAIKKLKGACLLVR